MYVCFKATEKPIKGILSPDSFVTLTWSTNALAKCRPI